MSIGMEKKANAQYHSEVWGVKPVVIDGRGIFISCFVFNYFFFEDDDVIVKATVNVEVSIPFFELEISTK